MKSSSIYRKSKKVWQKTSKLIPCGVQTLSKMPSKFVEGVYPIYLESGQGAWVFDNYNNAYLDYPLGLGAILLGHAYPKVVNAVTYRLQHGNIFTLPSILETKLAEELKRLIPSCEQVRFLKTGSEATSAAIKIARAYTKKDGIAYCGYHGWHDWFTIATPKNDGIPVDYASFINKFEYNNIESLETLFKNEVIGAVILEPYIYDAPKDNFLQNVIKLSHKYGAVVIFDEIVTGFRTPEYSAQKYFKAIPDLSTFGKAMGNGVPISFVCGKKEIMSVLEGDCFVSSTFGGDLLGISAGIATIDELQKTNAIDHITEMGSILKNEYNNLAERMDLNTKCIGYPSRTMFMFPTGNHKSLFWQECIQKGILFGYAQFMSYSHKEDDIYHTLDVIKEALEVVKKNWKNPLRALKGRPADEVFRLVVTKETNGINIRNN